MTPLAPAAAFLMLYDGEADIINDRIGADDITRTWFIAPGADVPRSGAI